MAAGLGYIEFATGDILTAAAANSYLASQVVMVFASASARTSAITSPQEGMVSYLKDTNAIEYYSGTAWVAVGGGGGGGKVLQVVQGTSTTQTQVTSTTFTDSTLTATITPSASTSKVLCLVTQNLYIAGGGASDQAGGMRLLRGSTVVFDRTDAQTMQMNVSSGTSPSMRLDANIHYLDSPATTSATTYKTQIAVNRTASSGTIYAQLSSCVSSIILLEIGA